MRFVLRCGFPWDVIQPARYEWHDHRVGRDSLQFRTQHCNSCVHPLESFVSSVIEGFLGYNFDRSALDRIEVFMMEKKLLCVAKAFAVTVVIGSFVWNAWATKLEGEYKFTGPPDGAYPTSGLVSDAAGNFYGATAYGGNINKRKCPTGCGTIFKLSRNRSGVWTKTVIYKFLGGVDEDFPYGNLALDAAGNIYGTALGDQGYTTNGTVFKLTPSQNGEWTETTLYTFTGGTDGGSPATGVILDSAGSLYGIAAVGGIASGVVFKLEQNDGQWIESILYSFPYGGGAYYGGLTFDAAGNLYGSLPMGGSGKCECGTVFELTPNQDGTWTESDLYTFTWGLDGARPSGGLIFDSDGNLYGGAMFGGSLACPQVGCGIIFQLSPVAGSWKYTVLHTFNGSKGANPSGNLAFGPTGDLYGTTLAGGDPSCTNSYGGCGTIFTLVPKEDGGFTFSMIAKFNNATGQLPASGVAIDGKGTLYGTTTTGGDFECHVAGDVGCGVLFAIVP